ncbi:cytochrome P450 [Sandarakinorhabdus sp.]|uniref:cytochrome P450 n=1 Tax=Sandarakinorhabdus sp. TaxID=1916663 RepID=UPI00286DEBE2|nr:cytochrome P450 [Sandarakinorhabdus sp.]
MATIARGDLSDDMNVPLEAIDPSDASLYAQDSWRPVFARLRAEAPVHYQANSPFGPFWSVSRHADIQAVEARPDIFSSSHEFGGITVVDLFGEFNLPQFIAMDRPRHGEQRRTVSPAFGPGEIQRMAEQVRLRTADLLDALPIGTPFDWVDTVSTELTTQMLAILFDYPWEKRRDLTLWSDWGGDIEAALNPATKDIRQQHLIDMTHALDALMAQRKALPPTSDLISLMAHSDAMGDMPFQERTGNYILLIVGGNDTTRNSMSGAIEALNLYPQEWEKMIADPGRIQGAVAEIIRWQTPLAHMRRTALCDADIAGVPVKQGDKIVLWYISGNRDESVFPDAERFDINRPNARRHLSFGFGVHRCVGARLAELQLQILFEEMLARRMTVRQTGPVERVPQSFVHGFRTMPVIIERH